MKYFSYWRLDANQDDTESEPELDEFVNSNFDNQDFSSVNSGYEEDRSVSEYQDFYKIMVKGEMVLNLYKNSKITTAATCIISEKIMDLTRKVLLTKLKNPFQLNIPNENIDFVTDTILNSEYICFGL